MADKKIRIGTVLTVPIALLALGLVACSKPPEILLAEARQSMAENDYPTASIALKNLLQDEPGNIEGRLLLAEVSMALFDPLAADKELMRARDLGADAREHMALYLDVLLLLQRNAEVLEMLSGEATDVGLDDAQALVARGRALLGLGNSLEAEKAFREALEIEANSPMAQWGIAASRAARGQTRDARKLLDQLTSQQPDFAYAWLLSGQIALREGQLEEAAGEFEAGLAALESTTDRFLESQFLAALIQARLAQGDLDAGEALIARLQRLVPRSLAARYFAAKLSFLRGDFDLASNQLEAILNAQPENLQSLMLYGSASLAKQDYAQAESVFTQIVSRYPDNLPARRLLAVAQTRLGESSAAVETLAPLLEGGSVPDSGLSVLAGQALMMSGSSERAITLLEEALERDPQNAEVGLNLASAYLSIGRPADATRLADTLPATADNFQKELILALGYAALEQAVAADRQIAAIVDRDPSDVDALTLAGDFYLRNRDTGKAIDYFERAVSLEPSHLPALAGLARAFGRAGRLDDAAGQYESILGIEPDNMSVMLALAEIYAATDELDQAIAVLERATDVNSVSTMPRTMLARAFIRKGDFARAEELAVEASRMAPDDGLTQAEAGSILLDIGRDVQALSYLRNAVTLAPDEAIVWYLLARAQVSVGESADARVSLNRSLGIDPDAVLAGSLMALVELRTGDLDRALSVANETITRNPESAGPLAVRADVLMAMELYGDAEAAYRDAYSLAPSGQLARRYYQAASQAGSASPAKALEEWTADNPDDWGSFNMLGMHYEAIGDYEKAIDAYERAVASNPENVVALNNLAWRYSVSKDERAESLAEKAHALRPNVPAIADTLGWIRVRSGDLEGGLAILEKAAGDAPRNGDIQYHLAYTRKELGDREGSATILRRVIESGYGFSERDNALALLEEVEGNDN
jgi:putative PEP-CTERM system TPR-repeat lipoprotein